MKYYVRKVITLFITLFIVTILTFVLFSVVPGDSARSTLGGEATEEELEALREEMGLNDPLPIRYVRWVKGAVTGDLGVSTRYHVSVAELMIKRMPITLGLTILSVCMMLIISFPVGIFCTKKRGSKTNQVVTFVTQLGMSIPPFFLGILISLLFGIILKWFTPGGYISPSEDFLAYLGFMIFPSLAVAIPKTAMLIRFMQTTILRQREQDYVKTARSKGMKERSILIHHILKNAFIPVIAFIAMCIADILVGSIFVEQVFNLPGIGVLLINSIVYRDFNVIQAIILYIAVIIIVINFIADVLYQRIDPRIQYDT